MNNEEELLVTEDRVEKTLLQADYVALIMIPPPPNDAQVIDQSSWNTHNEVWAGTFKFVETEFIMNMNIHELTERQIIQGNIILKNPNGSYFGNIPYTADGHNVKPTNSRTLYSVILEFDDKKVGLGLHFAYKEKAAEFDLVLQDYRKHAQAALSTHQDLVNDLEASFEKMNLDITSPTDSQVENVAQNQTNEDVPKLDFETDESDLEFGDFVTSEQ